MSVVNYTEYPCSDDLSPYVYATWMCTIDRPCAIRLLPTAKPLLMIGRTPTGYGFTFSGPHSRSRIANAEPGETYVGIWLRVGCKSLFHTPDFSTLCNTLVYSDEYTSVFLKHVGKELRENTHPQVLIAFLENTIRQLVQAKLIVRNDIVDRVLHDGDISSFFERVAEYGMSERQMRRLFLQYTALTPKTIARILRQRSVAKTLAETNSTIVNIAADHSYSDQAHLAHEFRKYIGVRPSEYEYEVRLF